MTTGSWPLALLGGAAVVFSSSLSAQAVHALQVVAVDTRGGLGGGVFLPANALGAPRGGGLVQGSTHVHSLGVGGHLTVQMAVPVRDGPGVDLLVAENAFATGGFGQVFGEVAFVEVSSNGVDFARFPARYRGPDVDPGAFGVVDLAHYENLAGTVPVLAGSAAFPNADPEDIVEAGGDAFDLADLRADPLVGAGLLDLQSITQVRLVDVRSGLDLDVGGRRVRDCGSGSADIDAVTAIQHANNVAADGPVLQFAIGADGRFTLAIDDPDGWRDLDGASLRASVQGLPMDAAALLSACQVTRADATGFTLSLPTSLPATLRFRLAFAVRDRAGHRCGVARVRP